MQSERVGERLAPYQKTTIKTPLYGRRYVAIATHER